MFSLPYHVKQTPFLLEINGAKVWRISSLQLSTRHKGFIQFESTIFRDTLLRGACCRSIWMAIYLIQPLSPSLLLYNLSPPPPAIAFYSLFGRKCWDAFTLPDTVRAKCLTQEYKTITKAWPNLTCSLGHGVFNVLLEQKKFRKQSRSIWA